MNKLKIRLVVGVLTIFVVVGIVASPQVARDFLKDQTMTNATEMWKLCVVTDELGWIRLREDCVERFDQVFLQEDFWGFNYNNSRELITGFARSSLLRVDVNTRSTYLPYDTHFVENRPTLAEVLDSTKQLERFPLINNVLNTPHCAKLTEGSWELDTSLYDVCKSRELVLHAYWLDICVTNFNLHHWWNKPASVKNKISEMHGSMPRHEDKHLGYSTFFQLKEKIEERDRFEKKQDTGLLVDWINANSSLLNETTTIEQLTEINLKNLWIMNHCKSFPYDSYQESLATLPLLGISTTKFKSNMPRELSTIYEKLMGIAARTGDAWAIRSINPPTDWNEDDEVDVEGDFFNFVFEFDSLLYHRYMASRRWGSESREERLKHVVRAYELTKQQFGEDITLHRVGIDKIYYPTQRLSHYVELNRFKFVPRIKDEMLDLLGNKSEVTDQ
ncbi:MAG: hypothetical protein F4039_08070 [Gammaproteobacteria bacterium]|nr:hypothetical protein [Gammaproteobacteria bacterium]MYF53665.1 hypothetical protein [Gammaproteobacteria bacterium]MYK44027.1 hypothetical protein [Gammaproteobacteria bacterium]